MRSGSSEANDNLARSALYFESNPKTFGYMYEGVAVGR
jgi:hypothetical protein